MAADTFYSLHEAIKKDDVHELLLLIETGVASIDERENDIEENTPLLVAASVGNQKMVELLVHAGAEVDAKNNFGHTAMHYAIAWRDFDMIRTLIDALANVNDTSKVKMGQSALHLAFESNDPAFVEYLLSRGADVNVKNKKGVTPLQLLGVDSNHSSHVRVAEILLENGADVNARGSDGKTLLLRMIEKQACVGIVELLLKFGADVNARDESGETALLKAIRNGDVEVVRQLINRGSDVNGVDGSGSTIMHYACRNDASVEIIKLLVKNGADVNVIDHRGLIPLFSLNHPKASENSRMSSRFLLKYSDVNLVDFCKTNRHIEIVKVNLSEVNVEHFAKLQALDLPVYLGLLDTVLNNAKCRSYLRQCRDELELAKKTKLPRSSVSFFDLLVEGKTKLRDYAGNKNLVDRFENSSMKFPIYGGEMQKNVKNGIKRRELFDESAKLLSRHLPIFSPTHSIVRDIIDCIGSSKDLTKFLR